MRSKGTFTELSRLTDRVRRLKDEGEFTEREYEMIEDAYGLLVDVMYYYEDNRKKGEQ